MQKFTVTTGFGYFEDSQGHIVSKAELPQGEHPIRPGYTYKEVADPAELAAVQVYQDPAEIARRYDENKIQAKIRAMAVQELINENELPVGYK